MFRCVLAMAQKDGILKKEELEEIGRIIQNVKFSDDQRKTLRIEIEAPINIDQALPLITEKSDRAVLAYYARILMHVDGEAHPEEQSLVKKLENYSMSHADSVDIVAQYQVAYADFEKRSDESIYSGGGSQFFKWFQDWLDN